MYKQFICLILLTCAAFSFTTYATSSPTRHGGEFKGGFDHISLEHRKKIKAKIKKYINKRSLKAAKDVASPKFIWPVVNANRVFTGERWAITNYVDHTTGAEISDFNGGTITYDGHKGTDIITWPFEWDLMANNLVNVVAASSGEIIFKESSQFDKNCSVNDTSWNAVYILHSDGSVAWYGHLKANSLLSKGVGEFVSEGEVLGVVGSSGSSTQPHLHLEIYDKSNNLIDPYAGFNNQLNVDSW